MNGIVQNKNSFGSYPLRSISLSHPVNSFLMDKMLHDLLCFCCFSLVSVRKCNGVSVTVLRASVGWALFIPIIIT